MNSSLAIRRLLQSITNSWCRRCWDAGEKRAGIAGNVWNSQRSADLSDKNFTKARDAAYELEESDRKQNVLKHIHNGARDAVAAKRMLSNLLGEVLSMQKGMFGTDTIADPEMSEKHMQSNDQSEDS